tara:strand:+ start:473 stop:682 length:210 start_codon:yes stop_codon:yes gene_type:complete
MSEEQAKIEKKSWYKSLTVQGVLAALVVLVVLPRLGVELPAEYLTEIYAAVSAAVVIGLRNASGGGIGK